MSPFDSFRTARWIRTFNLVLQAVLFLTLFGGLNYLARNHPSRHDLTARHRYSLSPETEAYLRNLPQPARVVVTITPDSENPGNLQAYRDVSGLLREYAYASEGNPNGRITVEYLDVYKNRHKAEEYGIESPEIVVVICGEKRRALTIDDLYSVKDKQREAFQGEQALTAALLEVSSQGRKKIYFLTGHGELNPEDVDPVRGLSALKDQLHARNFDVDRLDLATAGKIPADAALIVAVAPEVGYTAAEQEMLRQYLGAGAGRFIGLLAPAQPHGLASLLLDWGVLVDDDVVYDPAAGFMTEEGDLILKLFQPHPITQALIDREMPLRIGQARSVRPDPGRKLGGGLTVTTLAVTSKTIPLSTVEDLVDTRLAPKISQVKDVGLVSISGGQKPAVRIQANPTALSSYGIDLESLRTAITQNSVNAAKGNFDGPRQDYQIDANDQLVTSKDYEGLVVAFRNGAPVYLTDVAQVVDGIENNNQAAWMGQSSDGSLPPAVIVNVQRQPGGNTIEVVKNIKALLPQLKANLPAGIDVTTLTDLTTPIQASVDDVEFELVLTIGLVILVIFLFLRNLWATIIPAVAVPLSLIGTLAAMYALGYSLDNLSLMALTISTGFVVDDAIVMVENISRYIEEGEPPMQAALKGAEQIGFTILSLTVSLIAVKREEP